MSDREELELDRALSSKKRPSDPELASLFDSASGLQDALPDEAPRAGMHKAMFVQGVAARRRRFGGIRFLVPALACLILFAALAVLGRQATPGDDLYSVRTALQAVGLADAAEDEARVHIDRAWELIGRVPRFLDDNPAEARRLTLDAIANLSIARRLVDDEAGAARLLTRIKTAEGRAVDLLVKLEAPAATPAEDSSGPGSGDETEEGDDDDNSGSGSGGDDDDGGGDDRSGSGGGDDDD